MLGEVGAPTGGAGLFRAGSVPMLPGASGAGGAAGGYVATDLLPLLLGELVREVIGGGGGTIMRLPSSDGRAA